MDLNQINEYVATAVKSVAIKGNTLPNCNLELPTVAGKSAYDIAVEQGFIGSENAWLQSLKVKGDRGDRGEIADISSISNRMQALENKVNFTNNRLQVNGYSELPNGLLLQWGRYDVNEFVDDADINASVTITFPKGFNNNCLNVTATRLIANSASTKADGGILLESYTKSNAKFSMQRYDSQAVADLRGFTWFAIGY